MLSSTYTIADVKAELENDFSYFGYTTDALFVAALTRMNADVMRRYFIPRLGSTEYTRIATKNKVGLTEVEEALYWAEIMLTCSFFLKWKVTGVDSQSSSLSSGESLSVEGYSYKSGGSSGSGGASGDAVGAGARGGYYKRAIEYFAIAGYDIHSLVRGNSIYA